jgi:hypothetical protein
MPKHPPLGGVLAPRWHKWAGGAISREGAQRFWHKGFGSGLTRGPVATMAGKSTQHHVAARVFYEGREPCRTGREVAEAADDASGARMDEWAEVLVSVGIERRLAVRGAGALWAAAQGRDAACVASVGGAAEVDRAQLVEGLRGLAIKIYQAPKRGLSAGALLLATGSQHQDFASARDLAKAQGVSHELAANAVEEWQADFNLPRLALQKGAAARATYKQTNGKQRVAA